MFFCFLFVFSSHTRNHVSDEGLDGVRVRTPGGCVAVRIACLPSPRSSLESVLLEVRKVSELTGNKHCEREALECLV